MFWVPDLAWVPPYQFCLRKLVSIGDETSEKNTVNDISLWVRVMTCLKQSGFVHSFPLPFSELSTSRKRRQGCIIAKGPSYNNNLQLHSTREPVYKCVSTFACMCTYVCMWVVWVCVSFCLKPEALVPDDHKGISVLLSNNLWAYNPFLEMNLGAWSLDNFINRAKPPWDGMWAWCLMLP